MATWPDRFPGRLEYEVEDFADRDLEFTLDESLLGRGGPVVMRGALEHKGKRIALEVVYPDSFPFLRPEVYARELRLGRHQNPYEGNLCLLDRSTRAWDADWTAARLVAERVRYLLDLLEEGGEALRAAEAAQGEPASAFFPTLRGAAVFVPAAMLGLPHDAGTGRARLAFSSQEPPQIVIRALLADVHTRVRKGKRRNGKRRNLGSADATLRRRFSDGRTLEIAWTRLDALPESNAPADLLAAARAPGSGVGMTGWQRVDDGEVSITGCIFQEEVRQGVYEDAWLFLVEYRGAGGNGVYTVRGERLSDDDLGDRIPALAPLRERTVSLAGLGALGGPLALELARAQLARLRTLETDFVEAGNIVRWPVGLRAVGHAKTAVIAGTITADYPYTAIDAREHQIGRAALEEEVGEPEMKALERFVEGADLLIDATAEIGIGQLLSHIADGRRVAQLYVSATEGALGGIVARVRPGRTGCWFCLRLHLERGTIPVPPRDETGTFQPRGCATATFTGANFDLLPIVAQAARMAADLLVDPETDAQDVAIMSFQDGASRRAAPQWRCFTLAPQADCPQCGST